MKLFIKLAILVAIFYVGRLNAQDFQGMAVYESKMMMGDFKIDVQGVSDDMKKQMDDNMKKMFEKSYTLYFDKNASTYSENQKLESPAVNMQQGGIRTVVSGGGGTQYKNVKDQLLVAERDMMGKEFLIRDSLPKLNWKMTGETKKIGDYNCFKATAMQPARKTGPRPVRIINHSSAGGKREAEKAEKTTNILKEEEPKEVEITAWYAPEIPVSQGPDSYWGLPGLILEVNTGKTVILCSKIVMNPKDKKPIKQPNKGKVVTQKEFDRILEAKLDEMQQSFQNGGGSIRIGG